MESSSVIPLFPLQVVLLPGASIPLHVFEERYKVLITECARDGLEFGINLVLGGRVHRIGCTATLEKIIRRYPDGRLDIRVTGHRRYRLTEDYSAEDTPYFVGKVLFLDDDISSIDEGRALKARSLLHQVLRRVYKDKGAPALRIDETKELSYQLAAYSALDFMQRQKLLECSNEDERLGILIAHYTQIVAKLTKASRTASMFKIDAARLN